MIRRSLALLHKMSIGPTVGPELFKDRFSVHTSGWYVVREKIKIYEFNAFDSIENGRRSL